ncbi:MAG: metal ABC transporter permease [Micrococcaceae bacterium]
MSLFEFFADHTYRMVFLGTAVIGVVAGCLGAFAYLRKQSLMSDVISHAAFPGTLVAFLVAVLVLGVDGRNMGILVLGAMVVGAAAVGFAHLITALSPIRVDTAMAISLTLFFGAGMLLMRVISNSGLEGIGGIQDYLFGNASVMTRADLNTSLVVGGIALGVLVLCWKEFALRSFDPDHAVVLGFRGRVIDAVMFTSVVVATVIGVKAVGLVLMVAFVVTPPAAARQWTGRLGPMVMLSGVIGGVGSSLGAYLSIVIGDVPTGPVIVLVLFALFVVSMLCSPQRSVVAAALRRVRTRRRLRAELLAEQGERVSA